MSCSDIKINTYLITSKLSVAIQYPHPLLVGKRKSF